MYIKCKRNKPWSERLSGGGPLVKLSTLLQTGGGKCPAWSEVFESESTPLNAGGRVSKVCVLLPKHYKAVARSAPICYVGYS
ncbi:hypothetical protein SERLA73DRAFT_80640 [Serpula lacrymans var. lacrymans S7.3]|uniref:Uncharacterized protein n=1 Tax=Serpula lacrymans var. lacrymans (strain S7.3) TaxID=936435 RepID=F8QK29_SERL3|nr:hypothetical protein SERLA73DRAFT_80640 [Serpula lacrymans var. lacrymans S7.3]